jgi:hypothetical protein
MRRFVALACVAWSLTGCNAALDADALARTRRAADSLALEANLLIDETVRGDVTLTYARVHRDKLIEHLRDVAEDLDQPASGTLRTEADRVRGLVAALAGALQHMGDALGEGEPDRGGSGPLSALKQTFSTLHHDAAVPNRS